MTAYTGQYQSRPTTARTTPSGYSHLSGTEDIRKPDQASDIALELELELGNGCPDLNCLWRGGH
ncbi:unnamed protein product [Fusarium graminearum]|uniref:Chromosome 2, complete genome n=2 Tax=Gibberella zeae TaxID=5518 RepID=A0A098DE27_GIBZE|nr:unnamed protein product [Fusarium graminearum]CAF3485960.1 unnamed protein product [Fusarium graminearum]CAF3493202.1 unnamed protein product [Fusarium graminearum]CAG1966384.1 unnamed protein product [Fusarium graminearum]CAG1976694.1 unnamed protein product [Fusarium graminearum]